MPRAISITYYPTVSTLHSAGDGEGLRRTTEQVMRITMMLMAFIPVGMMAIAPWIVHLLYGEFFLPAVAPFLVLSVWGLVRPVGLLAYAIPKGVGKPMVGAWAMVLTAVLNVAFNALLIPPYGTTGAAVATTASYLIGFTYLTIVALRMVDAKFPWPTVLKAVTSAAIAGGLMLVIYRLVELNFDPTGSLPFLVAVTVGSGLAGLGLYVLCMGLSVAVTKEESDLVGSLGVPGSGYIRILIERVSGLRVLRDRWLGWDKGEG